MAVKPILFNTEMIRAILDGRKCCTRRVIKQNVEGILNSPYHREHPEVEDRQIISKLCQQPYQVGDVLYVLETWYYESHMVDRTKGEPNLPSGRYSSRYVYKADCPDYPVNIGVGEHGWKPSIHMPKEAARIWLKVTDVRVERLQEISGAELIKEGVDLYQSNYIKAAFDEFKMLWDFAIKKSDLNSYGWAADPWVWVIEFERCEKPKEMQE